MSKQIFSNWKVFLILFLVFFAIFFFFFNGTNLDSILSFKVKNLAQQLVQLKNRIIGFPDYLKEIALYSEAKNKDKEGSGYKLVLSPEDNQRKKELLAEADKLGSNMLYIPKFDVEAPIIPEKNYNLKVIYRDLMKGVILFPASQDPGKGYSIILGHSSHYPWQRGRYISVFRFLGQAEKGDNIYVIWDRKVLEFKVTDKKVFLPWPRGVATTRSVFPPSKQPTLILQSCLPFGWGYKRIALKTILEK